MARICALTSRKNLVVNSVTRRGKARAEGGVGRKTTGITRRVQKANLQKKAVLVNGERQRVWLSAKAIRTLQRGPVNGIALA